MEKTIIESERDVLQAILLVGVTTFFFGLLFPYLVIKDSPRLALLNQIGFSLLGIGSLLFAIYTLRFYLIMVPTIRITTARIIVSTLFSKKEILLQNIKRVGLAQKSPLDFLFITTSMESTEILLKDETEIIIRDIYYENINKIKSVLRRIYEKIEANENDFDEILLKRQNKRVAANTIDSGELALEQFQEFKGNMFLNFNGIIFWGFFAFIAYKFNIEHWGVLFILGFFYVLIGYQMNYFLLSNKFFQIRNHLWFWKKETYKITDIKEIVLEQPGKLSESVRLVFNSFATSLYPAGSLKNKHWRDLIIELEKRNIKVRNELYIED
jgi:hypothetical protein